MNRISILIQATQLQTRFDQAAEILMETTHCLPLSDDNSDTINRKRTEFNQNLRHREKLGKV